MPLEFKIQETGTFERCGTIQLAKRTIHTPVCLTYSLHGSVPHLVADNLKHLPVHLVHIFLEQLIDKNEPSSLQYPHGLDTYLHFENQVLFCDVRDLAQIGCGSSLLCTDKYLSVETPSGVQPFTTQDWIKAVTCYRPDIAVAMSDSVNDVHAGHRRIKKSVDRSLRWLDECLRDMKDKDIAIFAPVTGHTNELERARSAVETSKRDIQGFVLHLNGLKNDQLTRQIRASVENLAHEKPRLAYGLSTPEGILHGISNGIDMFDGSYAFKLTENGRAITFKFGDTYQQQEERKRTLNLWDSSYCHDFEPLDPQCGCLACSRPHSKAYIHHLLTAYEMLASVLLMSHNICQLDQFMASIRKSIKEGKFGHDKHRFMKHYSHDSESDGKIKHMDELDTDSLNISVKKKRTVF